jgi:putative ABC transport system permease protein
MIPARFLLRSLSLRHTSFLLALLAVTVAATLAAALLGIRTDLRVQMSGELKRFGPNLLLTVGAQARGDDRAATSITRLAEALEQAGFPAQPGVTGILLASGRLRPADREAAWEEVTLLGAEFASLRKLNPSWRLDGSWPAGNDGECVLGAEVAGRLGLHPGDGVEFALPSSARRCRVTGLLSTGESEDEEMLLPLGVLQEAAGDPGRLSLIALSVEGGVSQAERAGRIAARTLPGFRPRIVRQVAEAQGALLRKLDRLMLSLSVTVFVLCGLCVMTTLLSIVLEREEEIGLMRSLGAGDGEILVMFLGEVTLLAVLGTAFGILLGGGAGHFIGKHLFGAPAAPHLATVPVVLALSLLICWVSVLLPLRRALTIQPADALRGN